MTMRKPDSLIDVEKRLWKLVLDGSQSRDYNMQQEAEMMLQDIQPLIAGLDSNDVEWFESKCRTISIYLISMHTCTLEATLLIESSSQSQRQVETGKLI